MTIHERDVTYIVLSVYLITCLPLNRNQERHDTPTVHPMDHTKVNSAVDIWTWIDVAEYIQYTNVRIVDLCRFIIHFPWFYWFVDSLQPYVQVISAA